MLDLCDQGDRADVVGWVSAAVQRNLTTPRRLRNRVHGRGRLHHRRLILALIDDVGAGVVQVGPHRGPRGHADALHDARLDQELGTVTDRGDRTARGREATDEGHDGVVDPQVVG